MLNKAGKSNHATNDVHNSNQTLGSFSSSSSTDITSGFFEALMQAAHHLKHHTITHVCHIN